ncbi:nucleic acid-binding protein, partial [Caulochytrium protostelioides]
MDDPATKRITSISGLNPYQTKWMIRARCTQKSDIRKWSNARGEGQLFSCTLTDATGEIRVTAFKESVNQFYPLLENDQV